MKALKRLIVDYEKNIINLKNNVTNITSDDLLEYLIALEVLVLRFRKYFFLINNSDNYFHQLLKTVDRDMSFHYDNEKNIYKITFPGLIKNKRSKADINNCIFEMMFYLLVSNIEQIQKFEKATFYFNHCYLNEVNCSDYDNLEIKKMIDTLTPFFIADDSLRFLNLIHTSEQSNENKTEIYIFGENTFEKLEKWWIYAKC